MIRTYALTPDDLFHEVCDLANEHGVIDQDMWKDMVDEVVQGHLDLGELDPDQDTEEIKKDLENRWVEYRDEFVEPRGVSIVGNKQMLGIDEEEPV